MCKKGVSESARQCPTCRTDLTLLVDYVEHLHDGLSRAEALTRAGELGDAVWAYLQVLEVDPDNPSARRQVGQVAAAVRQFDRRTPGRRWLNRLGRQARFRHRMAVWEANTPGGRWGAVGALLVVAAALLIGFAWGYYEGRQQSPSPAGVEATGP
jgi:hypothetical protein